MTWLHRTSRVWIITVCSRLAAPSSSSPLLLHTHSILSLALYFNWHQRTKNIVFNILNNILNDFVCFESLFLYIFLSLSLYSSFNVHSIEFRLCFGKNIVIKCPYCGHKCVWECVWTENTLATFISRNHRFLIIDYIIKINEQRVMAQFQMRWIG